MILSEEDRLIVQKLAAFLRIADGLEKTHGQRVEKLYLLKTSPVCHFSLVSLDLCMEECEAVERKKDLFARVYGVNFRVTPDERISSGALINESPSGEPTF